MSVRWPAAAKRSPSCGGDDLRMQTRIVNGITIRPLRAGDTATVTALFEQLGEESRRRRFAGAKPRLSEAELDQLSRVDGTRHVLVAYLPGNHRPTGIAHLARDGQTAEIACAVADACQGRGIGRVLLAEMVALARAAGIRELRAVVAGDNRPALSLVTRVARLRPGNWSDGSGEFVVAL